MAVPLVSVCMITYNQEPFIAQAIESVVRQKADFRFELIIGEDCSTDDTSKIALRYQQAFPDLIRIITSEENVGAAKNCDRTVRAGQGRYIAYCEGDDYWQDPYKLQKQADYLTSHPECGVVFSDYDMYYDATKEIIRKVNYSKGYLEPFDLTIEQAIGSEGGVIRTCAVMVRKELLEQVIAADPFLHQSGEFLLGDAQLFAELSLISKVTYYPESLATYRIHGESATRSEDPCKTARFKKSACEMKLYLCDKHNLSQDIRRREEEEWCESALRLAFHSRSGKLAGEVRKKKNKFTLKESFQYLGAKYTIPHYLLNYLNLLGKRIARRAQTN